MRFIYLHGFASSPNSLKSRFFTEKLQEHGIRLETPDLAPDFENVTITSQLDIIRGLLAGQPSVLIGSSLGGYLAALYAAQYSAQVSRLVLLAPAFGFHQLWEKALGPVKLTEWREKGVISIYHYGAGQEVPLSFQLMQDAASYQAFPDFKQPSLILHGLKDVVVPFDQSERFASAHPANTKLLPFHSGHELTDVLNEIWKAVYKFLLPANTG